MTECPHCAASLFTLHDEGARLKANTTIIVLHKSGDVEINCSNCKNGVLLPLVVSKDVQLRKGRTYRPVIFKRVLTRPS